LLQETGLVSAFRLLTTGKIAPSRLDTYAEALLIEENPPVPENLILEAFDSASVRASPFAYALDISGETTIGLIEADPIAADESKPILTDGDWVALQGICGE